VALALALALHVSGLGLGLGLLALALTPLALLTSLVSCTEIAINRTVQKVNNKVNIVH